MTLVKDHLRDGDEKNASPLLALQKRLGRMLRTTTWNARSLLGGEKRSKLQYLRHLMRSSDILLLQELKHSEPELRRALHRELRSRWHLWVTAADNEKAGGLAFLVGDAVVKGSNAH